MTVAELITVLQKMPQDVEVLYRCCSDWTVLEAEQVQVNLAESREIVYRKANGYSDYNERWAPKDIPLEFRTVVTLPGN